MPALQKDNRWGINVYDTTKWGPSSGDNAIAYGLEVDWDGDGLFDGINDAGRLLSYSGFRGRKNMLRPNGSGLEMMTVGQYTFVLDNSDERYSPWNTSSPLYPNVTYGKDVRFRVRFLNGSASVTAVFYGIIQNITPQFGQDGNPTVRMIVQDAWTFLRNNTARVATQSSITTDAAIGKVLTAVGWPSRWGQSLDVSSDVIGFYWASGKNSAGDEIQNLAFSGYGQFFIGADGSARFRTRSDIPAAVLSLEEGDILRDVSPQEPQLNSRNLTRLVVHPYQAGSAQVIWKLSGTIPSIAAGASFSFTAPYSNGGSRTSAVSVSTPVAGTDWQVNSNSSGSGTDLTSSCSLTFTDEGDNAIWTVQNNSASTGYLVLAQVHGTPLIAQNTIELTYPSNPASVTQPREFDQDITWQQDANIVSSLVAVLGPFFASTVPVAVVSMRGRPDIQFTPELWDIVTLTLPTIGINGNSFRVAGINHASNGENCQDITTTFYLEPYAGTVPGAVFDTGVYDTGVFGW